MSICATTACRWQAFSLLSLCQWGAIFISFLLSSSSLNQHNSPPVFLSLFEVRGAQKNKEQLTILRSLVLSHWMTSKQFVPQVSSAGDQWGYADHLRIHPGFKYIAWSYFRERMVSHDRCSVITWELLLNYYRGGSFLFLVSNLRWDSNFELELEGVVTSCTSTSKSNNLLCQCSQTLYIR